MTESDDRQALLIRFVERAAQAQPTAPSAKAAPAGEFIHRSRLEAAARRALELFPGPIGELISREIQRISASGFASNAAGAHRPPRRAGP